MSKGATIILALLLVMGAPQATEQGGASHFVAAYGDDNNPGSLDQPWRTIKKANQELGPGDTVFIRQGEYDEIIEPYRSGEPGRPITYTNYEDEQVVIRGKPGVPYLAAFGLPVDGPSGPDSHVVIDGLTLSYGHQIADKRFGWAVIKGSASQYNEIRNCTIRRLGDPIENHNAGWDERGIILDGAKHSLIEGNVISGLKIGVKITNAAQYNLIKDNTIRDTYQSSISIGSGRGVIQGNLIEGNVLERSAIEDGIQFLQDFDAQDPSTDISNLGTIIRNNIIRNNAENAIDLKGAAHVVIEGNIIYGTIGSNNGPLEEWNRNSLATIMRGNNARTKDVIIRRNVLYDNSSGIRLYDGYMIYNNTLVANNRDFGGSGSDYDDARKPVFWGIFEVDGKGDDFALKNNIIAGHTIVEVALILGQNPIADIDYNLYRNDAFADFQTNKIWEVFTFSQWQEELSNRSSISGNDEHSLVRSDSLFAKATDKPTGDHSKYDFNLSADSPAVDAGGPLTRTVGSGSGTQIQLEDARYFFDGFGITEGDRIQIGNQLSKITEIEYENNIIIVESSVSWAEGEGVSLPYTSSNPDIGAIEYFESIPQRLINGERTQLYEPTTSEGDVEDAGAETHFANENQPASLEEIILVASILLGILFIALRLLRRGANAAS